MTLNKQRWMFWLEVSMMLLVCSIANSAKAAPPAKAPKCGGNVTSILFDSGYNEFNISTPFQLQSDGLGAYTTFSSKTDSVSSEIASDCEWTLDTNKSMSRGMNLTLLPYSNNQPAPPFVGTQLFHGWIFDSCPNNPDNNDLSFGSMTYVGQTLSCGGEFQFTVNGTSYVLGLNHLNFPVSSYMQVTCTGASSGVCNAWTVVPDPATGVINNGNGQFSAIAVLRYQNDTNPADAMGYYYLSFSMALHK
jgi:hypothetical protein